MTELEAKYLNDTLSTVELDTLRNKVNSEPLSEKESRLSKVWMSGDFLARDNKEALASLKRDIDVVNGHKHDLRKWIPKAWLVAACLSFIALTTSVIILSRDRIVNVDNSVLVSTDSGEKANITLPDGTVLKLGENSSVKYTQGQFNHKQRTVNFLGEGYFDVAKCPDVPFVVQSELIDVAVTGTKFLLISKPEMKQVGLILDEGMVDIHSRKADSSASLRDGQSAELDFNTGEIVVRASKASGKDSFSNTSIRFINTSLKDVLQELSVAYNVDIVSDSIPEKGRFTGRLSTTDLVEALDVLCRIYNLHVTEKSGSVIVSNN